MQRWKNRAAVVLSLAVAGCIQGMPQAWGATDTWDGLGADNNFKTAANWVGDAAPAPGDILAFDGTARPTPNNNYLTGTLFDGITFNPTATAAFDLVGDQINLNGNITDNTQAFTQTIGLNLALQSTPTVSVTNFGTLTISGTISGGFGLNEIGSGVLTLTGSNTFTGSTTVNNGATLAIMSDANLGAVPAATTPNSLVLDGGATLLDGNPTTTLTGSGAPVVNLTINAKRGISIVNAGGATPSFATINVPGLIANTQGGINSVQTITYDGIISDNSTNAGLTKQGFGNLVLGGSNTYTGATTIANGTINLDFTQTGAPTTNIISSNSSLTIGGGTSGLGDTSYAQLTLTGKASTTNSQTFNGANVQIGPAVFRVTSGSGGTSTLNLGALTHVAGGTANFILPNSGAITTTATNTNGILGSWATTGTGTTQNQVIEGTNWATVNGSGQIVAYTGYVDYGNQVTGDTGGLIAAGAELDGNVTAATNLRINLSSGSAIPVSSGSGTITDINTIAFTSSQAATSIVVGANNTLRFGKYGGIFKQDTNTDPASLFVGGATGSGTQTGNGTSGSQGIGTITAGGPTAGPGEIVFNLSSSSQTTGTLIIEPNITDNPLGGAVTVVKTGPGSMKLDGHNTYSGGLYIEVGRLQFAGAEVNSSSPNPDAGGTGPIYVFPGAQLFPSGAGSAAHPETITNPIYLAGIGINSDGTGSIRMSQGVTVGTASSTINLFGNDRIGGGAVAYVDSTTGALDNGSVLAGQITGNFSMDFGASGNTGGAGTLIWLTNPNNNWTGNTTLLGRVGGSVGNTILHTAVNNVIPNGVITVGGNQFVTGNFVMGVVGDTASGETLTFDLDGTNQTINGLVSNVGNVANVSQFIENNMYYYPVGQSGNTAAAPTGLPTAPSQATLTLGNNNQTATFSGIIRDTGTNTTNDPSSITGTAGGVNYTYVSTGDTLALTKIGSGIQTLSGANTYSGPTNINAGAISVTGSLNSSGAVNVNTSATSAGALFGTGSVGNVTLAAANGANKAVINPGSGGSGTVGTLTVNSLTAGTGSDFQFDLASSSSYDQLHVNNALTLNGVATISPISATQAGTYTIISAGSISGTALTLNTASDTRLTYSFDSSSWNPTTNAGSNQVVIDVSGSAANLTWTGAGDATTWEVKVVQNWINNSNGNTPDVFFNGDNVTFDNSSSPNYNVSVAGNVSPGSVTVNNSAGDYVFSGSGSITGSGTLVMNGTRALTIATNNSFSGGVTLNSGTLNINNNGALGTGTFTIAGGTIDNTSGQAITLTANPTQAWNTDVVFTGTNNLNLGTGNVSMNGGGLANGDNRTVTVNAGTLTVGGAITDNGNNNGLIKAGAGTLLLTGANTFNGPVTISAGTLEVGNFGALGNNTSTPATVASGATLDVGGFAAGNAANGFSVPITISGAGVNGLGALTNSGAAAQQNAFQTINLAADAAIGGNNGRFDLRGGASTLNLNGFTLTKAGTDYVALVGASVNNGNIIVNGGTLSLEEGTNITNNNDGTSITVNANATLQFYEESGDVSRPIIIGGNGATIGDDSPVGNSSNFASNITLMGNMNIGSTNGGSPAGVQLTVNGTITESGGSYSVTKIGADTVILQGTSNVYSGGTIVNGGILQFQGIGTLGSGPITLNGGTLQYNNNQDDISSLGVSVGASGGAIDTNGQNVTFANGISGNGSFTKEGGGNLTLVGQSTYTGSTGVGGGTLILQTLPTSFNAPTGLVFGDANNNSGTLDLYGHSITINSISSIGNSNGNQITSNPPSNTNVTVTFAGTPNVQNFFNGGFHNGNGTMTLNVTSGWLTLGGGSDMSGPLTISNGAILQAGENNSSFNGDLGNAAITNNGTLILDRSDDHTFNNPITGSGALISEGDPLNTVNELGNHNNAYTGGTTLKSGLLGIQADTAINNNGVGTITFSGGGLLFDNYTSNLSLTATDTNNMILGAKGTATLNSAFTTPNNFIYSGHGRLILAAANTFGGSMTVQRDTLTLGVANAVPSGHALIMGDTNNDSPTLDLNGNSLTVSALSVVGTGTPQISNSSQSASATLVYAGNAANPDTFSGQFQDSNNGGNQKTALSVTSGQLTLTNSSNFTGGTTISGGKLIIANNQALGNNNNTAGPVTINGAGTLQIQSKLSNGPMQFDGSTLSISGGGALDVTNNAVVIHNGNLATIDTLLHSGMKSGATSWTGPGINDSVAAADTTRATAVGAILNGPTYSNFPTSGNSTGVSATDVLMMYTWYGDLNLDGVVDSNDLALMGTTGGGWGHGDLNYDGAVNADDYALYMLGDAVSAGRNVNVLPEPDMLGLIIPAMMLGLRRRRVK